MKELEHHDKLSQKQKIEQEQKQKKKQEFHLINSITPYKGHRIWEINIETAKCKEAEFLEQKTISFEKAMSDQTSRSEKRIVIRPGHVYLSALNQKNALKRFYQNKGHALKPKGDNFYKNVFLFEL